MRVVNVYKMNERKRKIVINVYKRKKKKKKCLGRMGGLDEQIQWRRIGREGGVLEVSHNFSALSQILRSS